MDLFIDFIVTTETNSTALTMRYLEFIAVIFEKSDSSCIDKQKIFRKFIFWKFWFTKFLWLQTSKILGKLFHVKHILNQILLLLAYAKERNEVLAERPRSLQWGEKCKGARTGFTATTSSFVLFLELKWSSRSCVCVRWKREPVQSAFTKERISLYAAVDETDLMHCNSNNFLHRKMEYKIF